MKKVVTLLLISVLALYSCTGYHIRKADNFYEHYAFAKAINYYEKAKDKKPTTHVKERLASAYLQVNEVEKAHDLYEKLITKEDANPIVFFNYGKALMGMGNHQFAAKYFKIYLQSHPDDVVANMLLSSSLSVSERFRDTTLFTLKPIVTETKASAFGVVEYQDGIVFNADKEVFLPNRKSQWTGRSYLNLYFMQKDEEGNWLDPELLKGDISGPFHDGPATFNKEGDVVYFTRSNYFRRKVKVDENNVSNLKIFRAELVGDKWKNLTEFPFNSDDYSVGHPSLSTDGKTMYFVSDMPGGFGGTDIYKTTLVDGAWTTPENLGPVINTPGNEMFPYIHDDGSLYFSSNAHNSMGGLDVFITYFTGEKWAQPENLNYPINSSGDDFAFTINPETRLGFVSSSRAGNDAIYKFKKNDPTFRLFGIAKKKDSDETVAGVTVQIINEETGDVIDQISGEDGTFNLQLELESDYLLICTKEGCFARTDKLSTKGLRFSEDFYADFLVQEIVVGKPIVLENIYYDFDKYHIREDAALELEKLVKLLVDNPQLEIELGSHTDSRGSDRYNRILSDKRAKSVVDYLVKRGIEASRLTWKGYGKSNLINHCDDGVVCTEEEHQSNRRTEFKVVKIRSK